MKTLFETRDRKHFPTESQARQHELALDVWDLISRGSFGGGQYFAPDKVIENLDKIRELLNKIEEAKARFERK